MEKERKILANINSTFATEVGEAGHDAVRRIDVSFILLRGGNRGVRVSDC